MIVFLKVDVLKIWLWFTSLCHCFFMSQWRYINHSETVRLNDFAPQEVGQVEMTQMIDTPLHLYPFFGGFSRRDGHQSSIVDEVVDLGERNCICKILDWFSACKVEFDELYHTTRIFFLALLNHFLGCFSVSCADYHRATISSQVFSGLGSDSWVSASNDSILAFEVDAVNSEYTAIEVFFEKN